MPDSEKTAMLLDELSALRGVRQPAGRGRRQVRAVRRALPETAETPPR